MKKINLHCPLGYTGYGITSLNILKELDKLAEVSLFNIGNPTGLNSNFDIDLIKKCKLNAATFDKKAPCLKIWHQHDLANRIGSGNYYSFPFFELDTLSPFEVHQINSCDYVFTATDWSKDVLKHNGVKIPIIVCPLGVDSSIFCQRPKSYQLFRKQSDVDQSKSIYRFFSIGKWEKRKSQDIILTAFAKAFNNNDDVQLWLCAHNPFLNEPELNYWTSMVRDHPLANKITVLPRLPTQYDLANTIADCDCGVFVSRAEGWNNSILESMSMNKPCIVTNYSAHTHYCDHKNSFLIDLTEKELAHDGKWFFGQGSWGKIGQKEIDNIVDAMRYVYNNNIRSNPYGLETAQKYSWSNTAETIDTYTE